MSAESEREGLADLVCRLTHTNGGQCDNQHRLRHLNNADAILAAGYTRQSRAEIQAEALRFAQAVLAGEDPVEWARHAHSSTITLSHAVELLDDWIESIEDDGEPLPETKRIREGGDCG